MKSAPATRMRLLILVKNLCEESGVSSEELHEKIADKRDLFWQIAHADLIEAYNLLNEYSDTEIKIMDTHGNPSKISQFLPPKSK